MLLAHGFPHYHAMRLKVLILISKVRVFVINLNHIIKQIQE
jgi:hypothetical protein